MFCCCVGESFGVPLFYGYKYLIFIFFTFSLFTICEFKILLYVYTIKQEQLKTTIMKTTNKMPQWLQEEMNNVQLTNSVNEKETLAWYLSALTEEE